MRILEFLESMQTKLFDYLAKQETRKKLEEIYYSEKGKQQDIQIAREYFGIEGEQVVLFLKKTYLSWEHMREMVLEKYHPIHLEYITETREKLEEINSATSDEDRKKIAKKYFGIEGDKYDDFYKEIKKKISSGTVIKYGLICLEYTGQTKKETREKLEEIQKLQSGDQKRRMARKYFGIEDDKYNAFCKEIKDEISPETINKYELIILKHKEEARKKLKEIKNSKSDEDKRKMAREYFFIVGDDEYNVFCEEIKNGVSAKTIDKYLSQRSKYREGIKDEISPETINKYESIILAHKEETIKKLEEIKNPQSNEDKRKIAREYFFIVGDDEYKILCEEIKDGVLAKTIDKYLFQRLKYREEARKKLEEIQKLHLDEEKKQKSEKYFFIVGDAEYDKFCQEIKDGISPETIDKYFLQRLKHKEEARARLQEIKNLHLDEEKKQKSEKYFFIVGDAEYNKFCQEIKDGISPETIDKYFLQSLKHKEEARTRLQEIKNLQSANKKQKARECFFIVDDAEYNKLCEEIKNGISPKTINNYGLRYLKYNSIKNKLQLINDGLVNQLNDYQLKEKVKKAIDDFLKNNKEITIDNLELVKKAYGEGSFGLLISLLINQIEWQQIERKRGSAITLICKKLDSLARSLVDAEGDANKQGCYYKEIINFINETWRLYNKNGLSSCQFLTKEVKYEDGIYLSFLHVALMKCKDLKWNDKNNNDDDEKEFIEEELIKKIKSEYSIDDYIKSVTMEERVKVGKIPLTHPLKATIKQNNSRQI